MSITYRVEGLGEVRARMQKAGPYMRQEAGRAMKQALSLIEDEVKERTPHALGQLRRSIHTEVQSEYHGEVGTDLRHAWFVEEGARPHWAPGWALAAWQRVKGFDRIGFAMFVQTPARRMFRGALEASSGKVMRIFDNAVRRAVDRLNGK